MCLAPASRVQRREIFLHHRSHIYTALHMTTMGGLGGRLEEEEEDALTLKCPAVAWMTRREGGMWVEERGGGRGDGGGEGKEGE